MGSGGLFLGLAVMAAACEVTEPGDAETASMCAGAKCDEPDDGESDDGGDDYDGEFDEYPEDLAQTCAQRKDEAYVDGRESFSRDVLRWSCADVPGTHPDDRGQEYCEYFALLAVPGFEGPLQLGKVRETKASTDDEDQQVEVSPAGVELSNELIDALEADPYAEVGRCVFTSWNADVDACQGSCNETEALYGVSVTDAATFRMVFDANTFEAAEALVTDCMEYVVGVGDPADPDDLYHDDFMRACELNSVVNETEYRKSDSTVCASAMRLAECGCLLDSEEATLASGLSREGELGFPLGGWAGPELLPAGCRYESPRDGARQLVTCELTALEVLDHADELKSYCAQRYADDIVVHVPVPADAVTCDPDPDFEPYAHTCGDNPWNVSP